MATTQPGGHINRPAGADLSTKQYHIVKLNTDGEFVLSAAGSDAHVGVLQNKPVENQTADVMGHHSPDTGKVKLGGNVTTRMSRLTSNGSGQAVVTTTEDDNIIGYALQLGDTGDVIEYMPAADVIPPAS